MSPMGPRGRARAEGPRGNRSDLAKAGSKNKYVPQDEGATTAKNPAASASNRDVAVRKIGTQYTLPDIQGPQTWKPDKK